VTASNSTADATTASGTFKLVPKAPRGSEDVRGTAKLIRSDRGTDASIKLGGLPPNVRYASYVHAGSCDQPDPGGPHFKFDPDGADMPPNEIHLPFTSDRAGNGTAKTRNDQVVPEGEGRSIVVHRATPELAAGSGGEQPSVTGGGGHHSGGASEDASDARSHAHPPKIACAPLDSTSPAAKTTTP